MEQTSKNAIKAVCHAEYDSLTHVILCSPLYMKIREVINETQQYFVEKNIDTRRAVEQHESLITVLENYNVDVITLPSLRVFPEQVFTRDIGFTIGDNLFIAKMNRAIRQGEEKVLIDWLDTHGIPYTQMTNRSIEGGDVLVDRNTVWVGISYRTSVDAVRELQDRLSDYEVTPLDFENRYLHLDCVFNIISPDEALIFPPAFSPEDLEKIASRYRLIEITADEQFQLGTNVLCLGKGTVISLPMNRNVNRLLRKHGYNVVEVDISEIIKSGGAFRCITMPLVRNP